MSAVRDGMSLTSIILKPAGPAGARRRGVDLNDIRQRRPSQLERLQQLLTVSFFCDAMLCISATYAAVRCLSVIQRISGVARGAVWGVHPLPIRIEAVFFTAVKLLLLNIITSL